MGDGVEWCLYQEVEPYTVESVEKESRYLNLHGGGAYNGASVQVWNNPGNDNTRWRIEGPSEDGSYTLQNVAGDLYLNVEGGSSDNNADLQVWNNPHSKDSQWLLQPS